MPSAPRAVLQLPDDVENVWMEQIPEVLAKALHPADDIGAKAIQLIISRQRGAEFMNKAADAIRAGKVQAINPYRSPPQRPKPYNTTVCNQ